MLFSPCAAWSVPKSRWPGRTDLTDRLQAAFYGQLGKRWVRHSSGCVFVLKKQRHCSGWRRRRSADIVSTSHSHWLAWRLLLFRQTRKKHGSHGAWNSWQLLLEICVTSFSFTLLQAVTQPPSLLVSGKRWHWEKKLENGSEFQALAHIFLRDDDFETVKSAGERAFVLLYNGSPKESLDELRYRLFCSMVVTGTTCVQIHSLSPTSSAALFHSLRVDFQVQEWLGDKLTV